MGGSGHGFFSWDSTSHLLYYTLYHNIKDATTAKLVHETGSIDFNSALSPIRGYLTLSQVKELQLYTGKLSVQVGTSASTISGTIGCIGSCDLPAKVPTGDLCTVTGNSIVLYSDGALESAWGSWSWGKVQSANFADTTDKFCGSSSISTEWDGSSALSMHNDDNIAIDTSVYTHLEFFVKTKSGTVPLYVSFNENESEEVVTGDIVNYVVEDSWTRVRVPLSRFAITGAISRVTISPYWATTSHTLNFDMIRFVTDAAVDTLADPVSGAAAAYSAPGKEKIVES